MPLPYLGKTVLHVTLHNTVTVTLNYLYTTPLAVPNTSMLSELEIPAVRRWLTCMLCTRLQYAQSLRNICPWVSQVFRRPLHRSRNSKIPKENALRIKEVSYWMQIDSGVICYLYTSGLTLRLAGLECAYCRYRVILGSVIERIDRG